jgi:hypothetical protein
MPTFPTPPPVANALVAACEPLFAMIEKNPALLAHGERLIVALLDAAMAQDLGAMLLVRRLRGRLQECKRRAALSVPQLPMRGPRHG